MFSIFPLTVASSGVYYAFEQSDLMGKAIVVLLLLLSISAWSVMGDKWVGLRRARKLSESFTAKFRQRQSLTGMIADGKKDSGPLSQVYNVGISQLLEFYSQGTRLSGGRSGMGESNEDLFSSARPTRLCRLSDAQQDAIRTVMEREVSTQILLLEERIGLLGTIVSISPFLGLFGTTWGVMLAFCGVAIEGHVVISALAPGVSGALLTTVVGLVVAIPSLVGYNALSNNVRTITIFLDNFVEAFMAQLKLEQLALIEEEESKLRAEQEEKAKAEEKVVAPQIQPVVYASPMVVQPAAYPAQSPVVQMQAAPAAQVAAAPAPAPAAAAPAAAPAPAPAAAAPAARPVNPYYRSGGNTATRPVNPYYRPPVSNSGQSDPQGSSETTFRFDRED